MKKIPYVFAILLFLSLNSYAADKYILNGGTGDGSSWSSAMDMPSSGSSWCGADSATWVGGTTYWVGGSDTAYAGGVCFRNYSGSGTVTLKKATADSHGTSTGWDSSYGTKTATIPAVHQQSFGLAVDIDGTTGGGPGSWETGHGFVIYRTNADAAPLLLDSTAAVTVRHTKIGFNSSESSTGTYPAIYSVNGTDNITIQYSFLHDAPCDMVQLRGASNWLVEYSKFARNKSTESCHGDGIETDSGGGPHTYRYNWFEDLEGTYLIGCHCSDGSALSGLEFYGNIVSWSDTETYTGFSSGNGLVSELSGSTYPITGFKFYNNTIYNAPGTGSVSIGNYFYSGSDGAVYNNLFDTCNSGTVTYGAVPLHDYNWYRSCGTITETHKQDGSGDPFTNVSSKDFSLSANTTAGKTDLGATYATDLTGSTRTTWSRGAYEFTSGATGSRAVPVIQSGGMTPKIQSGGLVPLVQ